MAKNKTNIAPEENVGDVQQTPLMIHRQYLKDLSFENPNSPQVLVRADQRPEMEMNILLDVQKLDNENYEDYYEISLRITATARRENETLFVAEVIYGTTASIQGIDVKQHHPLLFIEVPQLMFPFARQIMANITQAGGFNAVNLAPVDFRNMYLRRFAEKQDKNDENSPEKEKTA